ncbi:MAG: ATP:cob(I)alamin adenosyltransferase, partial [Alphaproteobacteria bacterium]
MVKLTKIYTGGGDAGETSLGDGARVSKDDIRVAAYGAVDETNAVLGLVRVALQEKAFDVADAILARVQNDLFDLGADLCTPEDGKRGPGALRITPAQATR